MITRVMPGSVVVVAALIVPEFSVGAGDISGGEARDGGLEPIMAKDPAARRIGTAPAPMPALTGVRYAGLIAPKRVPASAAPAAHGPHLALSEPSPEPPVSLALPPQIVPAPSLPPAADSFPAFAAPAPEPAAVPMPSAGAGAVTLEAVAAPSLPESERAASTAMAVETPFAAVAAAERGEPLGAFISPPPTRTLAAPVVPAASISATGVGEGVAVEPAAMVAASPVAAPVPSVPQTSPTTQLAAKTSAPAKSVGLGAAPAPRGSIDQVATAQPLAARPVPQMPATPASASAPLAIAARPATPAAASAAVPSARAPITAPTPSAKPATAPKAVSAPAPAAAAIATVPKPAPTAPVPAASSRYQQVISAKLVTRVDGKTAGMVDFQQTPEGLKVRLGSVVEVLANRYDPAQLARIRQSSASDTYLPLAALQAQGIPISYDPVYDEFNVGLTDTRPKNAHKVHIDQIGEPASRR